MIQPWQCQALPLGLIHKCCNLSLIESLKPGLSGSFFWGPWFPSFFLSFFLSFFGVEYPSITPSQGPTLVFWGVRVPYLNTISCLEMNKHVTMTRESQFGLAVQRGAVIL